MSVVSQHRSTLHEVAFRRADCPWWLRESFLASKNAQKLAYIYLQFQKYFRGYTPGSPLKWGRGGMRREVREKEEKEGGGREGGEVACLTTYPSVVPPLT
jgi:hypothetical protein